MPTGLSMGRRRRIITSQRSEGFPAIWEGGVLEDFPESPAGRLGGVALRLCELAHCIGLEHFWAWQGFVLGYCRLRAVLNGKERSAGCLFVCLRCASMDTIESSVLI